MWVTVCLSCVALSWLFSEGIAWLCYVSKITRRSVGWFIFPYGPSEWDIPASHHTQLWKMFGFVNLWYRDESVVSLEYHLLPSSAVTWQSRFWVDGLPTFLSRSGGTLVWYTCAVQSYPLSLLWEPPWSEWMKTLYTFPLFSFFFFSSKVMNIIGKDFSPSLFRIAVLQGHTWQMLFIQRTFLLNETVFPFLRVLS